MAHSMLSKAKKSKNKQIKDQKHADLLFSQGIVHKVVIERLRKRAQRVKPNIKNNWVLHHDNAPCHTAILVNCILASKNIPVAPQPPYSSDLSPCDFLLFTRLKKHLKRRRYGALENIHMAVIDQLKAIPVSKFQHCYVEWRDRLQIGIKLVKKMRLITLFTHLVHNTKRFGM